MTLLNRSRHKITTNGTTLVYALGDPADDQGGMDRLPLNEEQPIVVEVDNGDYLIGVGSRTGVRQFTVTEIDETKVAGVVNDVNPVAIAVTDKSEIYVSETKRFLAQTTLKPRPISSAVQLNMGELAVIDSSGGTYNIPVPTNPKKWQKFGAVDLSETPGSVPVNIDFTGSSMNGEANKIFPMDTASLKVVWVWTGTTFEIVING